MLDISNIGKNKFLEFIFALFINSKKLAFHIIIIPKSNNLPSFKFDAKRNANNNNNKPSIKENKIAMIKLHKESEKIKEVLSANKEMNVYIENLADGDDFHTLITR